MKKVVFEDGINYISMTAKTIAKPWKGIFEVNELVNEAWLRCRDQKFTTISQLQNAARCDMIDYIRSIMGRKDRKNPDGSFAKNIKKGTARLRTNTIDSEDKEGNRWNPYEKSFIDKRFKQIDDQELIDKIFNSLSMHEKEKDIIEKRYRHNMGPNQIERETGVLVCTVFYYMKKNLEYLRGPCYRLAVEWKEKFGEEIRL